ncbi:hypothetical protein RAB80_016961 [Fusarium oxysporum f. sp. vasinfectum]|uniref:Uncharacterized protein n=1 Tax=Fusarium oxysporum f. sp. vasinfectum 25433 TaxID=1089449 RepID=X0KJK4_FUSOX|nr:hypothetical protein FOTG_17859 [Fusarium oxysporum f. sp. vasinfectum 25433]KAK2667770.1 hypothetical protein RAB80_016961 [Fusarium oxysporum f. sp. vasinfectum]
MLSTRTTPVTPYWMEVIRSLVIDRKFLNLQILITSREYIDIQTTKFRTWPNDLLLDVEDAVSTQVRVMFRWADRQLHELQRLTGERDVVSKALEDFLKTWMRLMAGSFFGHHRRIGNMFLMLFNGFGSVANLALPKVVLHPFLF